MRKTTKKSVNKQIRREHEERKCKDELLQENGKYDRLGTDGLILNRDDLEIL